MWQVSDQHDIFVYGLQLMLPDRRISLWLQAAGCFDAPGQRDMLRQILGRLPGTGLAAVINYRGLDFQFFINEIQYFRKFGNTFCGERPVGIGFLRNRPGILNQLLFHYFTSLF